MQDILFQRAPRAIRLLALAGFFAATCATAQLRVPAPGIDASGSTPQEQAACLQGKTPQSQATCLEEARNAAADKRRGVLESGDGLAANRYQRCDVFRDAEERAACIARIDGRGEIAGTVGQGGAIRAVETIVLPAGADRVQINPVSNDPVLLVPAQGRTN